MGMEAPDLPAPPSAPRSVTTACRQVLSNAGYIEVENCFSLSENPGSMVDMINVAARLLLMTNAITASVRSK
uniref:Uncharacterized protein n=1 Tax=Oryza meridionalis TaxID=40149 RepID=A0A0E0CY04_9ORYZ